ncbi:hypothetical protein HanRHA438_Chr14g0649271 [Helianthus annuus]|nr:hypothetical protein HanRHA438_Chr14g0649271 [Helianthus annuus]
MSISDDVFSSCSSSSPASTVSTMFVSLPELSEWYKSQLFTSWSYCSIILLFVGLVELKVNLYMVTSFRKFLCFNFE